VKRGGFGVQQTICGLVSTCFFIMLHNYWGCEMLQPVQGAFTAKGTSARLLLYVVCAAALRSMRL